MPISQLEVNKDLREGLLPTTPKGKVPMASLIRRDQTSPTKFVLIPKTLVKKEPKLTEAKTS